MSIKGILYFLLPSLAIILLNIFLGSIVSWFLSIAIIACLLYYFAQINVENIIYRKTDLPTVTDAVKAQAAQVIKKYKMILSFGLLTVIFISSVVCIRMTANPSGKHPWFFNNDYHGISNNGIAFRKELVFSLPTDDSTGAVGSMTIANTGDNKATLRCSRFFQPVFIATGEEGVYTPANNIFPRLFTQSFKISNGSNTIAVNIQPKEGGFFDFLSPGSGKKIIYTIELSSNDAAMAAENNISLPFTDHIVIEDRALKEGKSLYNLFLNSRNISTGKNESYAVLEYVLRQLGESYLLLKIGRAHV